MRAIGQREHRVADLAAGEVVVPLRAEARPHVAHTQPVRDRHRGARLEPVRGRAQTSRWRSSRLQLPAHRVRDGLLAEQFGDAGVGDVRQRAGAGRRLAGDGVEVPSVWPSSRAACRADPSSATIRPVRIRVRCRRRRSDMAVAHYHFHRCTRTDFVPALNAAGSATYVRRSDTDSPASGNSGCQCWHSQHPRTRLGSHRHVQPVIW